MNVTIFTRPIAKGRQSLYLSITHGRKQVKECLNLKVYSRPKDQLQRQHNNETWALAENLRSKRQLEVQAQGHGENPSFKRDLDFMDYFTEWKKAYRKADYRKVEACFNYFEKFMKQRGIKALPGAQVNELLVKDFVEYLKENVTDSTASAYYKKLMNVITRTNKEGITNIRRDGVGAKFKHDKNAIKKVILNSEEVTRLMNTWCLSDEVKWAFIFSLNTGFDYKTVSQTLEWSMVDGDYITFERSKTEGQNRFPLNSTAKQILEEVKKEFKGKKPTGLIFSLPGWAGAVKTLRAWAKRADIDKPLTWHSARHTFGYILRNEHSIDLGTLQDLLGHTDIKTTKRYEHLEDSMKRKAVLMLDKKKR